MTICLLNWGRLSDWLQLNDPMVSECHQNVLAMNKSKFDVEKEGAFFS